MKKIIYYLIMTMILTLTGVSQAFAYSYGDPGEEQIAEAYIELKNHLENDNWDGAKQVYDTYEKEFDLYFTKTVPLIAEGFEQKDKELILDSYKAALRLNVERRLHFADEQFEDYGQAKLLLAKARGTFNILAPYVQDQEGDEYVQNVYASFDLALQSLGNPGLFGIGNQENDYDTFQQETENIIKKVEPFFAIPKNEEEGKSHLTEENLDFLEDKEIGSSSFWLWFSVALFAILVFIVFVNKSKKQKEK
ncbi:hypothetical protein [Bacillus solimangrovi]|uniref:Sporulation protein YpjB n=1 Tax=Bacillus solimangrovi TaxID=1305675 RepID=A0A1E5LCW5_9BACI|nr:hypothetical protein [Bacillus solimangrovi]OEH91900.1 hypothetical protein BFG57_03975 [Bacillus solimangrovi]